MLFAQRRADSKISSVPTPYKLDSFLKVVEWFFIFKRDWIIIFPCDDWASSVQRPVAPFFVVPLVITIDHQLTSEQKILIVMEAIGGKPGGRTPQEV